MNKKLRAFLFIGVVITVIAVIVIIVIASFSSHNNMTLDNKNTETDSSSNTQSPKETIPSINSPVYIGSDISSSPFIGEFINTYVAQNFSSAEDVFASQGKDSIPKLTVNQDGTFILVINAYESGMLAVKGNVEVNDEQAVFTIKSKPSVNYLGDDIDSFTMRLLDHNDMKYIGEQIGTITKGDLFSRN